MDTSEKFLANGSTFSAFLTRWRGRICQLRACSRSGEFLEELIHARTRDLNQINTAWGEKSGWS